ncbi:MAG TPA: hypothetical protein VGK99_20620 [Acidobacteriota bacterium]
MPRLLSFACSRVANVIGPGGESGVERADLHGSHHALAGRGSVLRVPVDGAQDVSLQLRKNTAE